MKLHFDLPQWVTVLISSDAAFRPDDLIHAWSDNG
jgi:hypothetical protein